MPNKIDETNANLNQWKEIHCFKSDLEIEIQLESILNASDIYYYGYLYVGKLDFETLKDHEAKIINQISTNPYKTEFEPDVTKRSFFNDLAKNINAADKLLMISVALPYDCNKVKVPKTKGEVDASSWGYDYHSILNRKIRDAKDRFQVALGDKIKEAGSFVDTSNYIDRELAFLCGLGKYGKNQMLIHPVLGTQFHIGHIYYILEDLKLKYDPPFNIENNRIYEGCENCFLCVNVCPAKICGQKKMNRLRCISYLTQTKNQLTNEEKLTMGNKLYGCDICQNVCPANELKNELVKGTDHWTIEAFTGVDFIETLKLSQKAFKRQYGHSGFAWRGLKILKRNVLIGVGNSGCNELKLQVEAFSDLKNDEYLSDAFHYATSGTEKV